MAKNKTAISVWMSQEERQELMDAAKAQERTLSALVRMLALRGVRAGKPKPDKATKGKSDS